MYPNSSSSNNNSGCYEPYMMGRKTYGAATTLPSYGPFGRPTPYNRHESVRDCMYWPESLSSGQQKQQQRSYGSGSGYSNYSGSGGASFQGQFARTIGDSGSINMSAMPTMTQAQIPVMGQPKAFIQVTGGPDGKADLQPLRIPCQLGPSGQSMSPLPTMEPLTIKVTAPPGAGGNGPISFQIDPNQYMAGITGSSAAPRR